MNKSCELMLAERAEAIQSLVHRDLQRSRSIERILASLSWLLSVAAIGLFTYWLVFGSGVKTLFPAYHTIFVTLGSRIPGQTDRVNTIISMQGYMSFWQIHEIGKEVDSVTSKTSAESEN